MFSLRVKFSNVTPSDKKQIQALQLHVYKFAFGITILKVLWAFSKDPARTRSFPLEKTRAPSYRGKREKGESEREKMAVLARERCRRCACQAHLRIKVEGD